MDITSPGVVAIGLKRDSDAAADTRAPTSSGLVDNEDAGATDGSSMDISLDSVAVLTGTSGMTMMLEGDSEPDWRLGSAASRD